jgi:hypothetical protein
MQSPCPFGQVQGYQRVTEFSGRFASKPCKERRRQTPARHTDKTTEPLRIKPWSRWTDFAFNSAARTLAYSIAAGAGLTIPVPRNHPDREQSIQGFM